MMTDGKSQKVAVTMSERIQARLTELKRESEQSEAPFRALLQQERWGTSWRLLSSTSPHTPSGVW